jgi:uncharacterized protein (TIGR00369 family)
VRKLEASDPAFAERVRESFARQKAMALIGASVLRVVPGEVDIAAPFRAELSQQHGFLHGGISTALLDSACGYAALTLMPAGTGVLAVEFKVNLLAPADGESFVARGRVVKAGRTISVSSGDLFAIRGGEEELCATMLATMMTIRDRPGVVD